MLAGHPRQAVAVLQLPQPGVAGGVRPRAEGRPREAVQRQEGDERLAADGVLLRPDRGRRRAGAEEVAAELRAPGGVVSTFFITRAAEMHE